MLNVLLYHTLGTHSLSCKVKRRFRKIVIKTTTSQVVADMMVISLVWIFTTALVHQSWGTTADTGTGMQDTCSIDFYELTTT